MGGAAVEAAGSGNAFELWIGFELNMTDMFRLLLFICSGAAPSLRPTAGVRACAASGHHSALGSHPPAGRFLGARSRVAKIHAPRSDRAPLNCVTMGARSRCDSLGGRNV